MSRIAILIDPQFDDAEFRIAHDRLRAAGHEVVVVGRVLDDDVTGRQGGEHVRIEHTVGEISDRDLDALVIPGGDSPDQLRTDREAVRLTRAMALANKPVAAIGHGPWMLIEADVVAPRLVTAYPSLRTDLLHAGARWLDRPVVVDGNLITASGPDATDACVDALLHELDAGVPEEPEPTLFA